MVHKLGPPPAKSSQRQVARKVQQEKLKYEKYGTLLIHYLAGDYLAYLLLILQLILTVCEFFHELRFE